MPDENTRKAAPKRRARGRPRLDDDMIPRILDAAERLFAQRIALEVSIRDIADEAGMSHSAIYRYFEGKDDLIRQVLVRGARRQRAHEAAGREAGRGVEGAIDWIMDNNRAYVMTVARAALEGETPSSLGMEPSESTAQASLRVLEEGSFPFELRTDHDPRVAVAAATALALGWVVGERWITEAAGLGDRGTAEVRRAVGDILVSVMALGSGASRGPSDGDEPQQAGTSAPR